MNCSVDFDGMWVYVSVCECVCACVRALVFALTELLCFTLSSQPFHFHFHFARFHFFPFGFVVHSISMNFVPHLSPSILYACSTCIHLCSILCMSRHAPHLYLWLLQNETDQWTNQFHFRYIAQRIPFHHGICCTLCIDCRLLCAHLLHCTKDSITFAWQLRKCARKFDALPDGTHTK